MIAEIERRTKEYLPCISDAVQNMSSFTGTSGFTKLQNHAGFIHKHIGKVRDIYSYENCVVLFTTDRQSAFDRQLATVPYKGQVLNLTSLWWFEQTKHIVPNHVICSPNNNTLIAKKTSVFPIEFVMRGYITGTIIALI